MGRSRFDYRSYRGRRSASDWLKWIALVLAILVVLAVAALLWGQKYVTYTDKGLEVHLPFFSQEKKEEEDPGNVNIVVGEPEKSQEEEEQPQEEQPQEEKTQAAAAVQVTLASLLDGSAAQQIQEQGGDGAVVDMKNDQGQLGWQSQQSLATAFQPEAQDQQVNDKLQTWNQGDVYTVARLSCFRDETVGGQMDYTLQTTSGYRWKDGEEMHWSDPANQQVQDYLIGLMTELAQMGFDEIMLEHWSYPTEADGLLSNIQYGEQSADEVSRAFLEKALQALESYGTKLTVVNGEERANLSPARVAAETILGSE